MNDFRERRPSSLSLGLQINYEERAERKAQRDRLDEWRYNQHTADLIARRKREQQKEESKRRPERDKWKPYDPRQLVRDKRSDAKFRAERNKRFDAKFSSMFEKQFSGSNWSSHPSHNIGSMGMKQSSPKKTVRKPQPKMIVETQSARTEKKRKDVMEKWLQDIKEKVLEEVLKRITKPRSVSVLEKDKEAKEIETHPSTVSVQLVSTDVQLPQEEEPEAVSDILPVQNEAEEVVAIGSEAGHEKTYKTVCSSGAFHEPFVCEFQINPIVWIKNSLVEQLRHVKGLQHFIFEPGIEVLVHRSKSNNLVEGKTQKMHKNVVSFILEEKSDLRTNLFEERGDDATMIMINVKDNREIKDQAKPLITVWLNGHFQGLIGMIHEVLDREKLGNLE